MTVLERPGMQSPQLWENMAATRWHHSKWTRRRIIHAAPDKIHVDTKFTRYRADGSVLGSLHPDQRRRALGRENAFQFCTMSPRRPRAHLLQLVTSPVTSALHWQDRLQHSDSIIC